MKINDLRKLMAFAEQTEIPTMNQNGQIQPRCTNLCEVSCSSINCSWSCTATCSSCLNQSCSAGCSSGCNQGNCYSGLVRA